MFKIVLLGYLIAISGFFLGVLFLFLTDKYSNKFNGSVMGFTAGLLLSFICFEILPISFNIWGLYPSILGIILGVLFSIFLESILILLKNKAKKGYNYNLLKVGLLIAFGISSHNIPEGMAMGSLLNYDINAGIKLAILIAMHCLPEVLSFCIPIRKSGASYKKIFIYCFMFSLPMGIGTLIGYYLSNISPAFISLCLSFAGGVMLYITCGEVIPQSKSLWNGRFTTIFSCIGFIIGVIIIHKL